MSKVDVKNILIVGLGLMGGSYCIALKKAGYHIIGIARREETIQFALENDIIDEGASTPSKELIEKADAVVFCVYPKVFRQWILDYQQYFKPGTLITDVTGVKASVVYDIQSILRPDVEFIAAHPMAGKETSGIEVADDAIFKKANYIVVPTDKNTEDAIEWCKELGETLGSRRITVLTPEKHDEMIGYVSQLTHCIAVALMTCNDNEHLVDYTGDSFRDLTRIAKINENMWPELFALNKETLVKEMDMFIDEFNEIKRMINEDDTENLKEKMRLSTRRRALFDKK